jgi:hypothetical protein
MSLIAERKWTTLLFNPFVYIAGGQALGYGVVAIVVAGWIGMASNTHFDGVLDVHSGVVPRFPFFMAEGFIDWLCLAAVLFVMGKIVSRTSFRLVDVFGTQALARWPTLFTTLVTLPHAFGNYSRALIKHV